MTNVVLPGRVGTAGGQSVVFLTDEAKRIFDDLRPDAVIGDPPPPPATAQAVEVATTTSSTGPPTTTTTSTPPVEEVTTTTTTTLPGLGG